MAARSSSLVGPPLPLPLALLAPSARNIKKSAVASRSESSAALKNQWVISADISSPEKSVSGMGGMGHVLLSLRTMCRGGSDEFSRSAKVNFNLFFFFS